MRDMFKKDLDSHTETNAYTSIQGSQENPQGPKARGEIGKIDGQQFEKLSNNNSDVSDLLASFQKMRAEEQRLLELKQQIIAKQNDLQNRLIKEIEKKKTTIANLTSEIPDLQNRNQQLGQALGVDIYQ